MAQLSEYSASKKQVTFKIDSTLRSFTNTVGMYKKLYEAADKSLLQIMDKDGLNIDMFTMDYVREHLPLRFNSDNKLCQLKKITAEEQAELLKREAELNAARKDGEKEFHYYFRTETNEKTGTDTILWYIPKFKFTATEVYNLIKAAHNQIIKAANAEARAKKAAEKADKAAIRLAKIQAEEKRLRELLGK